LIRNAIEALEGVDRIAGPGLHGSRVIIESSLLESGLAAVDVTDTGAGLVSETREKIFDAFFSTKSAGLGMGLPISRSIVTRHQGTLDVLRTGPEGSTFRFTLPLVGGGASGRGESENRGLK